MNKRSDLIDQIRGFAIILMAIFHFSFDLNAFGYVSIDFFEDKVWFVFPRIIVFLFMFTMGISLYLAHSNGIRWPLMRKRLFKLIGFALLITAGTYVAFPERWIYFGTLHGLAACSLLALPFLRLKYINLIVFFGFMVPYTFFNKTLPFWKMEHRSLDYIPIFPWIGVVCFGIFAAHKGLHRFELPTSSPLKGLAWMGRKSLIIYLLHQPILYGSVFLFYKLTN